MSVRAEHIYLKNVFGVKELSFDPDGVSIIKGRNGSGKTSVIRAIHRLIEGGHHPDMLMKGTEDGQVTIELSDGSTVEASLTPKGTYYHLRGRNDVTARQLISDLTDEISVNPIEILRARPKDRGRLLLEAMPMRVSRDEVEEHLDPVPEVQKSMDWGHLESQHALTVLGDNSSGLIGELADERQALYGAKRDKEGTVRDLKQSLGEDEFTTDELQEEREEITRNISSAVEERDDALSEIEEWKEEKIQEIRSRAERKKQEARDRTQPKIESLKEDLGRIEEKLEQAQRQQQTRETVKEREEELQELQSRYSSLTNAIEGLRSLKRSYRSDLPEDVYIEDGEIYDEEDIPFENWNEERKIRFATMIAEMRMGDLQIIPIDGIEKLVGTQREVFLNWAEQSPAQFILTEAVEGQDLTVEHLPENRE